MRKNVFFYCTLYMITLCLIMTGCNKDEPEQPAKVQTYHVSILAGKGDANQQNGPRKALGLDGNTLTASWAMGEQVRVRNITKDADLDGSLAAESAGVQTVISGDLTGTINAGDVLELTFLSPDYTNQIGTLAYIAANCDYAVATIHVASVTWGSITFDEGIAEFENRQAIAKFTLMNEAKDAALNASKLEVEVDGTTYTVTPASATSEIFVALPGFSSQTIKLTATVGGEKYTYTSPSAKTFEDGKYYVITVGMSKKVLGFSIDPTHQIEFAHGNLQYNASTNTWRIAEQQYDYVGNWYKCYYVTGSYLRLMYDDGTPENADKVDGTVYEGAIKCNNTDDNDEVPRTDCWVDYFGWNTAYNPLKIVRNAYNYATTQDDFHDWGENEIYDPKANKTWPANTWRTLTADEWDYIFCERPNAAQLFGMATLTGIPNVGTIQGVIVFPDGFEVPTGFRSAAEPGLYDYINNPGDSYYSLVGGGKWPNTGLSNPGSGLVCPAIVDTVNAVTSDPKYIFNQNVFTLDQWNQLEAAGAVFLPAVGARMVLLYNSVEYVRTYNIGFLAWYWSSTHQGSGYMSAYAFEASYDATNYGTPGTQSPSIHPHGGSRVLYDGLPVRLVRDL